jgi:hypothetical protein
MNAETAVPADRPTRAQASLAVFAVAVALASFTAPIFTLVTLPLILASGLLFLSLPRDRGPLIRTARLLLLIAAPFLLAGLVRFTINEAVPGIVEGGRRALTGRSIAKLRVIGFTQDIAREQAVCDPDGDGVGSALLVQDLVGERTVRTPDGLPGGMKLEIGTVVDIPAGRALVADDYYFIVYLPKRGGGFTTDPAEVDEEAAERRWIAYAWPVADGHGERNAVFINEHEMIRVRPSKAGAYFIGPENPPHAESALGDGVAAWPAWKDKKPRATLPGDR